MYIKFKSLQAAKYTVKKLAVGVYVKDYKGRKQYLNNAATLLALEYYHLGNLVFNFDFSSRELYIQEGDETRCPAYFIDCYLEAKYDICKETPVDAKVEDDYYNNRYWDEDSELELYEEAYRAS